MISNEVQLVVAAGSTLLEISILDAGIWENLCPEGRGMEWFGWDFG